MAFTETTTTGYGTRVGRSFGSVGTGFLLFIAATCLLWWNEGRAVKTDKMLNEAEGAYVEMENPKKIDPALDGELVCASALATTDDSLSDKQFGIGAKAISLTRRVEYYQWVEHASSSSEDKLGGSEVTTTTYTYSQEWTSRPVQSSQFKDPAYQQKNFVLTQVEPEEQWAETVTFGAYKLNNSLIRSISSVEPVALDFDSAKVAGLNKTIQQAMARQFGGKTDSMKLVHMKDGELYYGFNPSNPSVGDVRITFEKVVPAKVTIIAQVKGETFKAYKAKNGKTFQRLVMGTQEASEIFEGEHDANHAFLWMLRILGIVLVIIGLKGIFGFLEMILKVVPFVANIIGWGIGVVCTVVGLVWSLIIIALAWLFYRPLIGISLLALAGFLVWVFAFKGKDKLKQMAQNMNKDKQLNPVTE